MTPLQRQGSEGSDIGRTIMKMNECVLFFSRRKLIASPPDSSRHMDVCNIDGTAVITTDDIAKTKRDSRSHNALHANLRNLDDSSTMASPHKSVLLTRKRDKISISNFPKRPLGSSTLLLIILVMVDIMCIYVQGFLPQTVIYGASTKNNNGLKEPWRFPTSNVREARNGKDDEKSISMLFSSGPSIVGQEQETTSVSLEWIEFYAPETGGEETPVLFLHGLLGSKRNFATCASMLARQIDKKRRIMGVDLRNHGETQPWSDNMSYPSMAQDVVNFLNSQDINKVILVGHSMGGKVAQALALLYPDLVAGLVVLDIAPVTYSREEDPHWRAVEDILRAVHEVIEDAEETGLETTKRDIDISLRKAIPDPALRAFVLTNYDSRSNRWKIPISTMVEELERIAGFDLTVGEPTLSSTYDGDVFIINGGQSRFVRHAYMDQIASYFPNHMLTTIRGSGHWVHAEAPDDLVALLKRYLDR